MNSKSEPVGFNHKRKTTTATSEKQYITHSERDEKNDKADRGCVPSSKNPKKKRLSPQTVPSNLEQINNTPNKKSRKNISKSQWSLLGALTNDKNRGNLDFSMDSSDLKSTADRQSPIIELGGNLSMLEVNTTYGTKSVTIRRRYRKNGNIEYNNSHFHVPYHRLPSLALASLQYCSIVPEINSIIKSDSNFASRLKVIQKKLLTISGK